MIPKRANEKLRTILDETPSYLKGQPADNGLAAHWTESAKQEIRDLKLRLADLDALTGPAREAAEEERARIELRLGDLVGDLF